ncbi:hypothetical protein EXIGLDRAFT_159792 [Exidia glandulosa HHB12029]|uniref:Uncharacterized protein n=1 Tax=Exidia glandulosa HHB12029 TaxID=1314781 RepID=A0A165FIV2_EXIGL|nr:hypothetical protein EXIGLDRAFT_159792 [Exidia glandulosa HHB12029]
MYVFTTPSCGVTWTYTPFYAPYRPPSDLQLQLHFFVRGTAICQPTLLLTHQICFSRPPLASPLFSVPHSVSAAWPSNAAPTTSDKDAHKTQRRTPSQAGRDSCRTGRRAAQSEPTHSCVRWTRSRRLLSERRVHIGLRGRFVRGSAADWKDVLEALTDIRVIYWDATKHRIPSTPGSRLEAYTLAIKLIGQDRRRTPMWSRSIRMPIAPFVRLRAGGQKSQ